jgi:hypothetical protein
MEPGVSNGLKDKRQNAPEVGGSREAGRKDSEREAASCDQERSGYWASLIAPLFTVLLGLALLVHVPTYRASLEMPPADRAAVISWIYSSVAVMLGGTWALLLSFQIVRRCWPRAPKRLKFGVIGALFITMVLSFIFISKAGFGDGIAREYVATVPGVHLILLFLDVLSASVVAMFSYAIVLVTWDIDTQTTKRLGLAIQWIRNLMYSGAVLLALTVFEVNRLLTADTIQVPDESSLVGAFSFGTGLIFTLLLFFIFGPAVLAAEDRLRKLLADAAGQDGFEKESWMIRHQLVSAPIQYLTAIGSIALPLASAVLSSLLTAGD